MNKDYKNKMFLISLVSVLLIAIGYYCYDDYQRQKKLEYSLQYRKLTLEEIINKGMDENNTASHALSLKKSIDSYVENNHYTVDDFELFSSKYGEEDDLVISLNYSLLKKGIVYNMNLDFKKGELYKTSLNIDGKKFNIDYFPIEEIDLMNILTLLKMDDICKKIETELNKELVFDELGQSENFISHDKYDILFNGYKMIDVFEYSIYIHTKYDF